MRVYLPTSVTLLRTWLAGAGAPGGMAFAVTPGLREWYSEGDSEELEYAATVLAGRQSLRLIAGDGSVPRRVVLAADVADADVVVADETEQGSVSLGTAVPMSAWRALMADDTDPSTYRVVAKAVSHIAAADAGDEDADLFVGHADELTLLWWGVQEAGLLVE